MLLLHLNIINVLLYFNKRDFFQKKNILLHILNVRCGLWYQHVCCVVKHWPLQDALKMASGWSSVLITSVHSCWPVFCWSVSRSVRQAGWSMCRLVVMIWAILILTALTHTRSLLWDHPMPIYSGPTPTASSVMCSSPMNWPRHWREPTSHATVSIQVSGQWEFSTCEYYLPITM